MKYKVVFNKIKADVSEETLMEHALKHLNNGMPLTPEALQEVANQLMETKTSVTEFRQDEPLQARREAITHLKSLGEVVMQYNSTGDDQYLGAAQINSDLNGQYKIVGVLLYLIYQGEEMLIAGVDTLTVDMVENLEREYIIYKQNGYDIGGAAPAKMFIPELGRDVELLPDLMMNNA